MSTNATSKIKKVVKVMQETLDEMLRETGGETGKWSNEREADIFHTLRGMRDTLVTELPDEDRWNLES